MQKKLYGSLILLLTAVVWGLAFVFQHTGMDSLGPFAFTGIRVGLGALFVRFLSLRKSRESVFRWDDHTKKTGTVCGLLAAAFMAFQQAGLVETNPGKAGFITALYIMIVPVLGTVFLKQKYSLRSWTGVVLGVIGLYLLCVSGDMKLRPSDTLVILNAVFFAIQVLYVDCCASDVDPLRLNYLQLGICSICCLIIAFLTEDISIAGIKDAGIAILYTGIVSAGIGFSLQLVGQKYVQPAAAALIMSLESVFSVIFDWVILKNAMTVREMLGCGIMFGATVIMQLQGKGKDNG